MLGGQQFEVEPKPTQSRTNFPTINGIHHNSYVGSQLSQGIRLDNFLTRTGDKPANFSRINVDEM